MKIEKGNIILETATIDGLVLSFLERGESQKVRNWLTITEGEAEQLLQVTSAFFELDRPIKSKQTPEIET